MYNGAVGIVADDGGKTLAEVLALFGTEFGNFNGHVIFAEDAFGYLGSEPTQEAHECSAVFCAWRGGVGQFRFGLNALHGNYRIVAGQHLAFRDELVQPRTEGGGIGEHGVALRQSASLVSMSS